MNKTWDNLNCSDFNNMNDNAMEESRSAKSNCAEASAKSTAGVRPSQRTQVFIALASVGSLGTLFFAYLMERSLAPAREASRNNFTSLGEMLIIPGFLCFGLLTFFSLRELYKIYRVMNDPSSYRGKNRRRRRAKQRKAS